MEKLAVEERAAEQTETLRQLTEANTALSSRALQLAEDAAAAQEEQGSIRAQAGIAAGFSRGDQPRTNRKRGSASALETIVHGEYAGTFGFLFFWQVGDAVVLSLCHVFVSHICLSIYCIIFLLFFMWPS